MSLNKENATIFQDNYFNSMQEDKILSENEARYLMRI